MYYNTHRNRTSSLLESIFIIRESSIGGAQVGAELLRCIQFCRAARPLFETRSQRGHPLCNNLNPVKNGQVGTIDKAASADIILVPHRWHTQNFVVPEAASVCIPVESRISPFNRESTNWNSGSPKNGRLSLTFRINR